MTKKTKNEFDGLTVDELKARRDECQRSIDELLGKRQKLDDKIHIDILNGNLFGYKGGIFENLIADIFSKMDRKLYYFRKDSGLELDFVIRYKGRCVPVEVKASDGNAKSVKTVLKHPEKYHVESAIKLADLNIDRTGEILTLPHYLAFLLTQR